MTRWIPTKKEKYGVGKCARIEELRAFCSSELPESKVDGKDASGVWEVIGHFVAVGTCRAETVQPSGLTGCRSVRESRRRPSVLPLDSDVWVEEEMTCVVVLNRW